MSPLTRAQFSKLLPWTTRPTLHIDLIVRWPRGEPPPPLRGLASLDRPTLHVLRRRHIKLFFVFRQRARRCHPIVFDKVRAKKSSIFELS